MLGRERFRIKYLAFYLVCFAYFKTISDYDFRTLENNRISIAFLVNQNHTFFFTKTGAPPKDGDPNKILTDNSGWLCCGAYPTLAGSPSVQCTPGLLSIW